MTSPMKLENHYLKTVSCYHDDISQVMSGKKDILSLKNAEGEDEHEKASAISKKLTINSNKSIQMSRLD